MVASINGGSESEVTTSAEHVRFTPGSRHERI